MDLYNLKNNQLKRLNKIYFDLYKAMINKDKVLLDKILDPNFTLTHMTGLIQSKNEFISSILNGTLNYYQAKHVNTELKFQNNQIYLIGESKVLAKVFGGSEAMWRLKLNLDFGEKGESVKQITASTF